MAYSEEKEPWEDSEDEGRDGDSFNDEGSPDQTSKPGFGDYSSAPSGGGIGPNPSPPGNIGKDPLSSARRKAQQTKKAVDRTKKTAKATKRTTQAIYRVGKMAMRALRYAWRAMSSLVKLLAPYLPAILIVLVIIIVIFGAASSIVALGDQVDKLLGKGTADKIKIDDKLRKEIEKEIGEEVAATFDCSNFPPAERRPGVGGNCIEGLLTAFQQKQQGYFSPIPKSANWLLPIYRGAAKHYGMPWQVLASINGSRSSFGSPNCADDPSKGVGFMRSKLYLWEKYAVDSGSTKTERTLASGSCQESSEPVYIKAKFKKKRPKNKPPAKASSRANYFEATDAIYTEAAALNALGTSKLKNIREWNYTGSPAGICTASQNDGKIIYPPMPSFDLSGNLSALPGKGKILRISRQLIKLGDMYKKKFGPPSTAYKGAIPKKTLIKMLKAIWIAFGATPRQAQKNAEANYQQVVIESSGRPYAIQTVVDVNSGGNEAGGLFQFIPGTFDTWKVAGFNDRFNAVDNLLAGVNAQVNSDTLYTTGAADGGGSRTVKVLAGQGGWGPSGGRNPYLNKRKVIIAGAATSTTAKVPYKGKPQTDPISRAMLKQGYSPCYVAIIHDWYKMILKYPPQEEVSSGLLPGGVKRLYKPKKFVPCPKSIAQESVQGNRCYMDARIVANALYLSKHFKIHISDGYDGPIPGKPGDWSGCGGCHADLSEHTIGAALDINAGASDPGWKLIDKLARLTEPTQNAPKPPFRWVGYDGDAGHGKFHHIHLSWNNSGVVPHRLATWVEVFGVKAAPGGFGGGGLFPGGKGKRTRVGINPRDLNHRWPEADSTDGWARWGRAPSLKPQVVSALAEAAGRYMKIRVPGKTMMLAIRGESALKPGSSYDDPGPTVKGWGLWAITSPYGNNLGVPQMGGYKEMLNPVKNALVMTLYYLNVKRGCGSWEGTWHGWDSFGRVRTNLHYKGSYDIRKSLGGKTFKEVADSIGGRKLKRIKRTICR